jgi:hypothetical protein
VAEEEFRRLGLAIYLLLAFFLIAAEEAVVRGESRGFGLVIHLLPESRLCFFGKRAEEAVAPAGARGFGLAIHLLPESRLCFFGKRAEEAVAQEGYLLLES